MSLARRIRIGEDAWVSILNNVVTRARIGITAENYSGNTTTHPAAVISNNTLNTFRVGMWHNLHYVYGAPGFTYANNTVNATVQSPLPFTPVVTFQGLREESIQTTVFATFTGNTLNGNRTAMLGAGYTRDDGINPTNAANTSPNSLFTLNSVTNFVRGVFHDAPAVATFTCNNIAGNLTGVLITTNATGGLIAHNNDITGNTTIGMRNDGPATPNAQANWWGAASGPGPVGPGTGDKVSTNVDFSNWLTNISNCPPPCATNVALASYGATATASTSANANFLAGGAIDGEHNGNAWGSNSGWNDRTRSVFPDDIQVNLNVVQSIDTIDVYTLKNDFNSGSVVGDFTPATSYGITAFDVQTWNGATWVTVPGGSVTGNTRAKRRFSFATPISTDQIRVVINGSADGLYSRVVEIEAYSCAPVVVPTPSPTPTPTPTPSPTPTPCVSPSNNVALASNGSTAVASTSANASFLAGGAIDGEHNGNTWGSNGGWNDRTRGVFPDDIQVTFAAAQTIREIDVYTLKNDFNSGSTVNDTTTFTSYGITNFNVQYWTGAAWTDVPGGAVVGNNLVKRKFIFADITTDKIRVVVNGSADNLYSRVVEIEAFACAPVHVSCVNPGGTGGCFSTIQAAVNAASPGDQINVAAGTYPEGVNVNKRVTLRGAQAGGDPRAGACDNQPATESVVSGNGGTTPFYLTASDVTIDGFTVTGQTNVNQFGAGIVIASGIAGAHVVNNKIHDNVVGLFLANNSAANQGIIRRNLFCNNTQSGSASGHGIYSDQFVAGGPIRNVLIDSNNFVNNNGYAGGTWGIGMSNTDTANPNTNLQVVNNTFDSASPASRGMYFYSTDSSSITGNSVTNKTNYAIGLFGADDGITIECNTIQNNIGGGGRGIYVSDDLAVPNTTIAANYNNISGNPTAGLAIDAGTYTGVFNAENNWWGSATGPTIASNPGGTGDAIVDPGAVVDYTPFATAVTSCPTITVSPANPNGWVFFDDFPGMGTGSGGFESGPATPPLGVGSAYLLVDPNGRHAVGTAAYVGTRMDAIGKLSYSSYQGNNANLVAAIALQFDIDYDLNDATTAYAGRLVFEPYLTPAQGAVQQNAWQTWDARAGKWYGTRMTVTVNNVPGVAQPCQPATPCTWQQVLTLFPNAGVEPRCSALQGRWAGGPGRLDGNVDAFKFGVGNTRTTINFEPVP